MQRSCEDAISFCILDSNVWVFGFLDKSSVSRSVVDSVVEGERETEVTAYIFQEVFEAFGRSKISEQEVEAVQNDFAELVFHSESVVGPTQGQVEHMSLPIKRQLSMNQMMGRVMDIQPKDVPIVGVAWKNKEKETTIYTADFEFSQLDTEACNWMRSALSILDRLAVFSYRDIRFMYVDRWSVRTFKS